MKKRISEAQIAQINAISILNYCEDNGIEIAQKSRQIYLKDVPGVSISPDGRKWYDFYAEGGGGIVQFVMWYKNCQWIEAVNDLLGERSLTSRTESRRPGGQSGLRQADGRSESLRHQLKRIGTGGKDHGNLRASGLQGQRQGPVRNLQGSGGLPRSPAGRADGDDRRRQDFYRPGQGHRSCRLDRS